MVVVSCGDVHSESHSAGGDTVQAQGWSVVEREQPFAELEAAKKFAENVRPLNLQLAGFARARSTRMRNVDHVRLVQHVCMQ